MEVQRGVSLQRLCCHRWLSYGVRHSALLGHRVTMCHDVVDAGAITFDLIIDEVVEGGGGVARHAHELGRERGRRQHPSEPPRAHVHGGREAIREPIIR